MYQKKMEEDIRCPLEYGLQVFGGKWKSRILCVLNEMGTLRYGELKSEMMNITDALIPFLRMWNILFPSGDVPSFLFCVLSANGPVFFINPAAAMS